ncbi:MAG: D-alanyl-D-alanine carboxypeptidase family protein [Rhodanobacter sp.]
MASKFIKSVQWLTRLRGVFVATLLVGLGGFAGTAHAGYAAIVVDAQTGQVLNEVNADDANHPASLTKMMTLYIAFQELKSGKLKIEQELSVSANAANKEPTKLGLLRGQTISVQDCVLGIVTKSANDAATVLAEGIGGSEEHFVDMMNAQALLLGMTRTHFDNASGLPGHDATTARDLVKLAMALYRDFPKDTHYFATREFSFRGHIVRGHNRLMARYPGMDGLKTGYTAAAGFNLASTAVRDGRRLFGVVMGGRTAAVRDNLMARLLDDSFDHRQTPAVLVAEAGDRGGPVRRSHTKNRVVLASTVACTSHKAKACVRAKRSAHAVPHAAAQLAKRKAPASHTKRAKETRLAQSKHVAHKTKAKRTQLAHSSDKKTIVVATRSHERD